jgi:hypothetical protein
MIYMLSQEEAVSIPEVSIAVCRGVYLPEAAEKKIFTDVYL